MDVEIRRGRIIFFLICRIFRELILYLYYIILLSILSYGSYLQLLCISLVYSFTDSLMLDNMETHVHEIINKGATRIKVITASNAWAADFLCNGILVRIS